ncbi:DNA-processing protein DprA [Staphylococcus sp. SQ8-PEA]|uniref:DNA-processing protein DprA n=1 Tax=Staphylococcus marylandisciuri TaxID=2981529 RepID=A0ABT2QRX4_9STAP|nr:DNA-processing protein DprA [Staphylococcus marylandisciuri]MCU5746730.1 DNA-processing protein DprA [Staphylococcus marylandisciuri]
MTILKQFPSFLLFDKTTQHELLLELKPNLKNEQYIKKVDNYLNVNDDYVMTHLEQSNVKTLFLTDNAYPFLLKQIYDPPYILFYRGAVELLSHTQTLAIIGARNATEYTTRALKQFFPAFKDMKLTIVSGLAKGADHLAHQLSLGYGMPSIAVLGFGHSHHYPKETYYTRLQIEQNGIAISEYLPSSKPQKYYFPQRNRIISGLSKGVFVTEARRNSGTHITTTSAIEQNREVYILPGSLFNPMTEGNMLSAQDGARIVLKPNDITDDYR